MHVKNILSLTFGVLLLVHVPLAAQTPAASGIDYSAGPGFRDAYKTPEVPEADMANSPRLDQLLRAGKLYLSLSDAIALAIENNLDIAYARYGPQIADTDILRTKSGQQLRGVQTQISTLSTGQSAAGGGAAGGGDVTGITGRAGGVGGGAQGVGDASTFFGSAVPSLEPTLTGGIDWGHFSNPQTSSFVTGTNTFVSQRSNSNIGIQKGFLSGANVSLDWANALNDTNSLRANFDPSLRSNLTLRIRQSLLQGFGRSVNSRNIRIAKNNREVSDLAFKSQVIATVTQVQNLYWDLVSFRAEARSREEDLRLAQKLYADNKRRVEIGTLAPIEIVRAEAEVASREQDLTLAVTRVQLQETTIKNAVSKNGLASPSLLDVEIVPTDRIEVPDREEIRPVQDLMGLALRVRPELIQSRIQLKNQDISLKGVRNAMLPQVSVFADLTNNALAGRLNEGFVGFPGIETLVSDFFLGGLGTSASQIFRRNFPDYSIGVQVSFPLKNRRAQADMTATLLERRQADIRLRQQENSIRAEVRDALIGVQQARARFTAAEKTRILQERTLDAEQKKFKLGASTIFFVVEAQRDLALARSAEIAAQNNYIKSKVALDRATGKTLGVNNIAIDEAYDGRVSKSPDPIPPNPEAARPAPRG